MKKYALLFLSVLCFSTAASAECPLRNRIYTDGRYGLEFDTKEKSATNFTFKITNTQSSYSFNGVMVYGNGYASPHIHVSLPCAKSNSKDSCDYLGTVYEIDGRKTKHGFGSDEKNPILFPELEVKFYRVMTAKSDLVKVSPKDVWFFQACKKGQ